jgi:hypothetical protein
MSAKEVDGNTLGASQHEEDAQESSLVIDADGVSLASPPIEIGGTEDEASEGDNELPQTFPQRVSILW